MPDIDGYRLGTCQQVAATSTSTAISNAFGSQSYYVRVVANTACHIKIGDGAQSAATTDPYFAANWPELLKVTPGQRLAAIRASTGGLVTATDGTLSVTELTL